MLQEGQAVEFADSVERMLQGILGVAPDAVPEDEPLDEPADAQDDAQELDADEHTEL